MSKKGGRVDKNYCMSHYLAFRFIEDEGVNFFDGLSHRVYPPADPGLAEPVADAEALDRVLRAAVEREYEPGRSAVFLSGGIDSAIVASYLPPGTRAYTFKCEAPGAVDETPRARAYADYCRLEHEVIPIGWRDFIELTPEILSDVQTPFHSIQVMLIKASRTARARGLDKIFTGGAADIRFGGLSRMLSRDWECDEFRAFYTYTDPAAVLREPVDVGDVYERYRLPGGKIAFEKFMHEVYAADSNTTFEQAFRHAGVRFAEPYAAARPAGPLDLRRIRNGEPKYLLRELFARRYPGFEIPGKIPMPRAVTQWLADYHPHRPEFIPGAEARLTGDQKWQLYCLERFLDLYDGAAGGPERGRLS